MDPKSFDWTTWGAIFLFFLIVALISSVQPSSIKEISDITIETRQIVLFFQIIGWLGSFGSLLLGIITYRRQPGFNHEEFESLPDQQELEQHLREIDNRLSNIAEKVDKEPSELYTYYERFIQLLLSKSAMEDLERYYSSHEEYMMEYIEAMAEAEMDSLYESPETFALMIGTTIEHVDSSNFRDIMSKHDIQNPKEKDLAKLFLGLKALNDSNIQLED